MPVSTYTKSFTPIVTISRSGVITIKSVYRGCQWSTELPAYHVAITITLQESNIDSQLQNITPAQIEGCGARPLFRRVPCPYNQSSAGEWSADVFKGRSLLLGHAKHGEAFPVSRKVPASALEFSHDGRNLPDEHPGIPDMFAIPDQALCQF